MLAQEHAQLARHTCAHTHTHTHTHTLFPLTVVALPGRVAERHEGDVRVFVQEHAQLARADAQVVLVELVRDVPPDGPELAALLLGCGWAVRWFVKGVSWLVSWGAITEDSAGSGA